MPSKTYSEEFKRDGSRALRKLPESSIQTIATDLGINRATLHNWLNKYGTGIRTKITTTDSPSSTSVTEAEWIRQLEWEVSRLREERDILPPRPLNIFPARDELVIRFRFACNTTGIRTCMAD